MGVLLSRGVVYGRRFLSVLARLSERGRAFIVALCGGGLCPRGRELLGWRRNSVKEDVP